ncbi:leucine zipper domain-containing protein [Bryobacter aggregatus]|uniref:leucine zipper domain-containing protein n=1 Tax=Bryobacter aggregatus TaxID=360054 RepID=UPI00138E4450
MPGNERQRPDRSKWVQRFRPPGSAGLVDRSSRPHRFRCLSRSWDQASLHKTRHATHQRQGRTLSSNSAQRTG